MWKFQIFPCSINGEIKKKTLSEQYEKKNTLTTSSDHFWFVKLPGTQSEKELHKIENINADWFAITISRFMFKQDFH